MTLAGIHFCCSTWRGAWNKKYNLLELSSQLKVWINCICFAHMNVVHAAAAHDAYRTAPFLSNQNEYASEVVHAAFLKGFTKQSTLVQGRWSFLESRSVSVKILNRVIMLWCFYVTRQAELLVMWHRSFSQGQSNIRVTQPSTTRGERCLISVIKWYPAALMSKLLLP